MTRFAPQSVEGRLRPGLASAPEPPFRTGRCLQRLIAGTRSTSRGRSQRRLNSPTSCIPRGNPLLVTPAGMLIAVSTLRGDHKGTDDPVNQYTSAPDVASFGHSTLSKEILHGSRA